MHPIGTHIPLLVVASHDVDQMTLVLITDGPLIWQPEALRTSIKIFPKLYTST